MSEAALGERMNANTVAVVSGTPGGTYFRMASDMAFVLDDGDDLRILPILGKGAGQNAYDIRFLKGVDLGFVRTDTLDQLREDKRLTNVDRHITYIARLFNDELHVIAPREVTDIRQLAGKKVSFDVKGSGTDYTGRSMFKGLGLDIEAVNIDQSAAFDLLKRGELAAVVSVAAKPVAVVAGFDPGERFHVLPVPFVDALADKYFPATLTAKDYPKLVPEGATVNTLAVGTVLGAYNWPAKSERYKRIARFIDVFFSKFDEFLKPPRHAKWREVNLAAGLANWKRFPAA
ncbi:MAG: TAXI family TRAP transporter solute-binding subunit, partial [Microvirga sp.]